MDGIRCAFLGRLGDDAIVRYTREGTPLVRFSAAAFDSRDGASAEWVNVAQFGQDAEELAAQLAKGSSVYVEGRLRLAQWTTADGERRSALDVTASKIEVLGVFSRQHASAA
jgi:single-strand DNA-binding protein